MKSYAIDNVFSTATVDILRRAERIVELIPDAGSRYPRVRCHEVARIVAKLCDLQVHDGRVMLVEHSWCSGLSWYSGPGHVGAHKFILDPYCVGRLPQVQLCDLWVYRRVYERYDGERSDIDTDFVEAVTDSIRSSFDLLLPETP